MLGDKLVFKNLLCLSIFWKKGKKIMIHSSTTMDQSSDKKVKDNGLVSGTKLGGKG